MNNCFFVLLIWLFVFLASGITEYSGGGYDYPAPRWLKRLGNPFSTKKEYLLSMALLRVCNNILLVITIVGYFFKHNLKNYWKVAGAKYSIIIIILCCVAIIIEEVFAINIKIKRNNKAIGGNIYLICFFSFGCIFMIYMYCSLLMQH
ncbi:hypothetical protein [Butyrivibrio sp. AE2005]|uniref:hypothetical protein n=1 Tax=Butyrivibrio sp. AE2005 TaxID=1496722 RepID=UPI00047E756D|nr:hypothetical protein [Butyrivibrio sp. AE2005]